MYCRRHSEPSKSGNGGGSWVASEAPLSRTCAAAGRRNVSRAGCLYESSPPEVWPRGGENVAGGEGDGKSRVLSLGIWGVAGHVKREYVKRDGGSGWVPLIEP